MRCLDLCAAKCLRREDLDVYEWVLRWRGLFPGKIMKGKQWGGAACNLRGASWLGFITSSFNITIVGIFLWSQTHNIFRCCFRTSYMFSCKVPSFSEPCDLLWKTEVYVETHLKILGVCDKRKIPTVTNEVFCSFLQDSAGVRLTQVAVCFFAFPYSQ